MLDKTFFKQVREDIISYAKKRREVIGHSAEAQNLAKKSIFANQRDDAKLAQSCLLESEKLLKEVYTKHGKDRRILDEGAYRASLEEFAEAYLFNEFLLGRPFGKIKGVKIDNDIYIGGLCDVPGEILRYAIKSATDHNFDMAKKCREVAAEIIGELVDMDLTGYNRNKFDQAKGALHKLEQVVYEISI